MVSIKDVAKHAGVAISTVSKVLNNYPNISDETKSKVRLAIEELHFVPNSIAAALSSKQSGRVAMLINPTTQTQAIDEIAMQYMSGAINQAKELGMDLITVFFSMLEGKTQQEITRYFQVQSISGILIFGMTKENKELFQLIQSEIFKVVVIDAPLVNASTTSLWINQEQSQYDVAWKTIKENNAKSILYIAGKKNGFVTQERINGIKKLAIEKKLSLLIKYGEFSELFAREITFSYAKNKDVVVCASDIMAIGAMNALIEMDIFRPVCGYDGITLMGYVGKQMNTVRQNFYHIAQEGVKELNQLLCGGVGKNRVLGYEIVRLNYIDIIC